jgi:hypothetical protein
MMDAAIWLVAALAPVAIGLGLCGLAMVFGEKRL